MTTEHYDALETRDPAVREAKLLAALPGPRWLVLGDMGDRGWGRIVIISSESWRIGLKFGLSHYAAAKAGAQGWAYPAPE